MQPSQYGFNFAGPFLGLNTVQAPHMLAPGFATVAEDVLVTLGGAVRPREPFEIYGLQGQALPGWVVGMVHLDEGVLAAQQYVSPAITLLAKSTRGGTTDEVKLFRVRQDNRWEISWQFAASDRTTNLPPTWVFANRWLYIIDGSEPLYKYNGAVARTVGIEPPTVNEQDPYLGNIIFVPVFSGSGIATGTYQYAVTFYDSETGVESNPVYSDELELGAPSNSIIVEYTGPANVLPGRGILSGAGAVRIYRKTVKRIDSNADTVTTPFYRLIHVFEGDELDANAQWQDDTGLDDDFDPPIEDIALSDTVSGPFAPSRNGRPPAALMSVYYKRRMWYADRSHGSLVWYSELNQPDHVGATSSVVIGGDPDDKITGMVEMAGQLVILKESSIWIISGDLVTYTNDDVALGTVVFPQLPEIYKSKSKTGCDNNLGGNGAIVCGHPPMLYYGRADGLYRFDGVDDRPVSDLIGEEWAAMLAEAVGGWEMLHQQFSITFANDVKNQVLFICLSGLTIPSSTVNITPKRILCYHWGVNRGDGVGVWTTITRVENPSQWFGAVTTALGRPIALLGGHQVSVPVPFIAAIQWQPDPPAGLRYTNIAFLDPESSSPVPAWKWRTGDLPLAGGKKAHAYYLEYRHERYRGEVGAGPLVKVQYAVGAGDLVLLGNPAGQDTNGSFLRRLHLGRTGRSMALEFSRGDETIWDPWNGITGFAVDVELAEQR